MIHEVEATPIDTQALASGIRAEMALEQALHPDKHPITRVGTDELVNSLQSVRSMIADKQMAMEQRIRKVRAKYEPDIERFQADAAMMEQEISDRIKALGGRGTRTDDYVVRIEQESGKLVKNVPLLRKLATMLTPEEYASVYKQTPKTGFTEDFDARKLAELRDFYGVKHEVGELIANGMYHAPTPASIVIEPRQNAERAA